MPKKNSTKQTNTENEQETVASEAEPTVPRASKFTFRCTRCEGTAPNARCCLRGNIPLTFWDLELWAKNKVVANMLAHLAIDVTPAGLVDLVIKSVPVDAGDNAEAIDATKEETEIGADKSEEKELRCDFYRVDDQTCLIYENRPLFCREFPLEYDGDTFALNEIDCPGVGVGPMTKEELQQIREEARLAFTELRHMRISLPILNQIISQNAVQSVFEQMSKGVEERMKTLSEEDRKNLDEINRKLSGSAGSSEEE